MRLYKRDLEVMMIALLFAYFYTDAPKEEKKEMQALFYKLKKERIKREKKGGKQ